MVEHKQIILNKPKVKTSPAASSHLIYRHDPTKTAER